jgi:hypothetical protein
MTCEKCGREIRNSSGICVYCAGDNQAVQDDGGAISPHRRFCSSCGEPLSGGGFCSFCGTRIALEDQPSVTNSSNPPLPPVAAHAKSTSAGSGKAIISLLSLGVFLWILYQSGIFSGLLSTITPEVQQSMHESFDVGYWNYRVDKMLTLGQLGKGSFAEKPDGRFVVIFLTVKNGDTTASTLPPPTLRDSDGREHSTTVKFGSDLPGDDLSIVTLNPGVTKSGYFIFDVPADALVLKLALSGGFKSGQKALVPVY